MHTKLSPGPLKVSPLENSCMFHISLAIYTVMIILFEAEAGYVHWTSESTHYGFDWSKPSFQPVEGGEPVREEL